MAHERAESVGEGESYLRVHLRLVDALHLVLDRVLDRRDIHVRPIQNIEHGVKRRRFAGTRRPRDEDDAGRLLERMMDTLHILAVEPEHVESEALARLTQEAHHRLLAEEGREDGDAEGDAVGLRLHLESAVLREAFLVQFQIRENLDACDDTGRRIFRERHRVVENAVNTVAHQNLGLHRLNMDVGGALHDGVPQKRIHDTHDRQILGHLLDVIAREIFSVLCDDANLTRLGRDDVSELILQRLLVLQERRFDALGVGQPRQYLEPRLLAHRIY